MKFEKKSFGGLLGNIYLPEKEKKRERERENSLKLCFIYVRSLKLWQPSCNVSRQGKGMKAIIQWDGRAGK